jgi:pimeloyl-ACP methyl ester carboxylesterase
MKLHTKAVGLLAGVTVAASSWATYMVTRKGVKTSVDSTFFYTPFETGVPFETVSFHNSEGMRLMGWWLDRPATRKVVVLCPGYGRSKSDLLGVGTRLWKAGFNVLMFDFRDQGESDPAIATIGHFETDDLESALDYVLWRMPEAEIGVLGYSMGAAVGIMTTARRHEIRALVSDSSFADLRQVLRMVFKQLTHLPPSPSMELAELLVWVRAGYRISSVRPVDHVGQIAPRPILIIHGDCDVIAPVADAHALYAAAGEPKELWLTPDIGHCGTYFLDREVYVNRVTGFFEKWLGVPEKEAMGTPTRMVAAP